MVVTAEGRMSAGPEFNRHGARAQGRHRNNRSHSGAQIIE